MLITIVYLYYYYLVFISNKILYLTTFIVGDSVRVINLSVIYLFKWSFRPDK